jgi:hypothetical protein
MRHVEANVGCGRRRQDEWLAAGFGAEDDSPRVYTGVRGEQHP